MGCTSNLRFVETLYRVHYGPARPPVNCSSLGSCLRLLVLLWVLLQASVAAHDPEIPPPTPPPTSAPQVQYYLDHTYSCQPQYSLATGYAIDFLHSRPDWS